MQWIDAADGGCGGGLDFAPMHAVAPSRGQTTVSGKCAEDGKGSG